MEIVVFLCGILAGLNAVLLWHICRNRPSKVAAAPLEEKQTEQNLPASTQWANIMAYDGTDQGGVKRDED